MSPSRSDDRPGSTREHRTEELLAAACSAIGTERTRLLDQVVLLNVPVARSMAARYRGRGEAVDDLEQVACLALVKAAHGFRPGAGRAFLAYAAPTINGELRRHFRDHCWDVRPPRRFQELRTVLGGAVADLTQETGSTPGIGDVAARLGLGVGEVVEALTAMEGYSALSLDAPCDGASGVPLGDVLSEDAGEFDAIEERLSVRPLLASLPARDRRILSLRYYRGWTQREIAEEIGVTQMQVSRLLTSALVRLREKATA